MVRMWPYPFERAPCPSSCGVLDITGGGRVTVSPLLRSLRCGMPSALMEFSEGRHRNRFRNEPLSVGWFTVGVFQQGSEYCGHKASVIPRNSLQACPLAAYLHATFE